MDTLTDLQRENEALKEALRETVKENWLLLKAKYAALESYMLFWKFEVKSN